MAGSDGVVEWRNYRVQVQPRAWYRRGFPGLRWLKWPFFLDSDHPHFEMIVTKVLPEEEEGVQAPRALLKIFYPSPEDGWDKRLIDIPLMEVGERKHLSLGMITTPTSGHTRIRLFVETVPEGEDWETLYWFNVYSEERAWSVFWGLFVASVLLVANARCRPSTAPVVNVYPVIQPTAQGAPTTSVAPTSPAR